MTRHRDELLTLLGGNNSLLAQIEQAENDYLFFLPLMEEGNKLGSAVKSDLKALTAALETLHRLYTPRSDAGMLFEGEAVTLAGAEILFRLRDAVSGLPGELLIQAATAAAAKFEVHKGLPRSRRKPERLLLVEQVAGIAEQAGIAAKREERDGEPSALSNLLQLVFDRLEIYEQPDGYIRDVLKHRESASTLGAEGSRRK